MIKSKTQLAEEAVLRSLQDTGKDLLTTSEVMKAIKAAGLPVLKTFNRLARPNSDLESVWGEDLSKASLRFRVKNPPSPISRHEPVSNTHLARRADLCNRP